MGSSRFAVVMKMTFEKSGETATIPAKSQETLKVVADLWRVPYDDLYKELTTTTYHLRGETIVSEHTVQLATAIRDMLAVSVYKYLFDWLFDTLNAGTSSDNCANWIGLLDIFGFEDFAVNSFEQARAHDGWTCA